MKRMLVALVLFAGPAFAAGSNSPTGLWQTIDDSSGKPKSLVRITETNGQLQGVVLQILPLPGNDVNAHCDKCDGEKKGKPVVGMEILWGMHRDGDDGWSGGSILDPKKGKTYSCNLKVVDDGKHLRVRGYLGFSLLGRSQTWNRIE